MFWLDEVLFLGWGSVDDP